MSMKIQLKMSSTFRSLDYPKAIPVLGHFVGSAVLQSILALDALPQLLEGDFGVDPKREFAAAVFKRVQSEAGTDGLADKCTASRIQASSFLSADPTLDPDAESIEDWIKKEDLVAVPI